MSTNDIVEQVLSENPELRPSYEELMIEFENFDNNLEIKLECLSIVLRAFSKLGYKAVRWGGRRKSGYEEERIWGSVLHILEEYVKKCNEDELFTVEVCFFEGILDAILNIEDDCEQHHYITLMNRFLGPCCIELCRKNNPFWGPITLLSRLRAKACVPNWGREHFYHI